MSLNELMIFLIHLKICLIHLQICLNQLNRCVQFILKHLNHLKIVDIPQFKMYFNEGSGTSIEVTVVTCIKVNHRFEAQFTSMEVARAWQAKVTSIFHLGLNLFSC